MLNVKLRIFRKYVLSKQNKFLYVLTTENYDVTKRHVEFSEYRLMIQRVEEEFE